MKSGNQQGQRIPVDLQFRAHHLRETKFQDTDCFPIFICVLYRKEEYLYVLDFSILYRISKKGQEIKKTEEFLEQLTQKTHPTQDYFYFSEDEKTLIITKFNWQISRTNQEQLSTCKYTLSYQTSRAFLAFQIIRCIQTSQDKEIDFELNLRTIKSKRQKILQQIATLHPEDLDPWAKLHISSFFDFELSTKFPIRLDSKVYNQRRFDKAVGTQNNIVFNPTKITCKIFQETLKKEGEFQVLFYGNSGIGKSLSIVLMTELFKIIIDFRILQPKEVDQLLHFGRYSQQEIDRFNKIPKIYYITVTDQTAPIQVINNFKLQTNKKTQWMTQWDNNKFSKEYYGEYLRNLKKEYDNLSMNVVFIVDQINKYYSLAREQLNLIYKQYSYENIKDQLANISYSFSSFKANLGKVIYNSSPNIEITLINTLKPKQGLHQLVYDDMNHIKIDDEIIRSQKQGFLEIVNTVIFQCERKLQKKKKNYKQIHYQRSIFQTLLIQHDMVDGLYENYSGLTTLFTHLRIREYINSQTSIPSLCDIQDTELLDYFEKIKQFTIEKGITQFKNFLTKDDRHVVKMKKFQFLHRLQKQVAQFKNNESQTINKGYFSINFKGVHSEQLKAYINKQSIFINQSQNKIDIYYPPTIFLYIIQRSLFSCSFIAQIMDKILQQFGQNGVFLGHFIDNCITKLITRNEVSLYLNNQKIEISFSKKCHFIHFNERKGPEIKPNQQFSKKNFKKMDQEQEPNKFIKHKFGMLFKLLQNTPPSKNYIAAFPAFQDNKGMDVKYSFSSKCIDCLLMRRLEGELNKYQLITMDFSIAEKDSSINQKKSKADDFFTKLSKKIKYCSYSFQINHYFVVSNPKIEESQELKLNAGRFKVKYYQTDILDLRITIDKQIDKNFTTVQITYERIIKYISQRNNKKQMK